MISVDGQIYTKVDGRLVALDGETGKVVRTFEVDGPGSLLTQWLRDERGWIYGLVGMTEAFSNWGSRPLDRARVGQPAGRDAEP